MSVFFSARDSEPSFARSSSTYSATPSIRLISGLFSRSRMKASSTNISKQIGAASVIHWKKLMRSPVASSMRPRPIRLGGLPTGVSKPPTLAP